MKIRLILFFTLCFLTAGYFNASAQSLNEDALLENWARISQTLQTDTLLAALFEMESSDRFGTNEAISGTLYLWSSGYRIETDQTKMLVIDGISTVLDATQRQVIISTYVAEDDDFAPAKLLQKKWLDAYTRNVSKANQTIRWSTEDPFENFASISLRLTSQFPYELVAEDQLENNVALFLSNQKWVSLKTAKKSGLFLLETPTDFELIDLRDDQ